jgi:hypothetical protein
MYKNDNSDNYHNTLLVQIGITDYGLTHIGDITSISCVPPTTITTTTEVSSPLSIPPIVSSRDNNDNNYCAIQIGQPFLTINWEAYTQTYADELYHTVWESIEGSVVLKSLLSGKLLLQSLPNPQKEDIDHETVLAEILCTNDEWNYFLQQYNSHRSNSSSRLSWSYQQRQGFGHSIKNQTVTTIDEVVVDDETSYNTLVQKLPPGKFSS